MALTIVSFTPTTGPAGTDVTISVHGMDNSFTVENTKVYLDEQPVPDVQEVNPSAGTVTVGIDAMCRTGPFSIQGGDNRDYGMGTTNFEVTGSDEGAPVVESVLINKASGFVYPGDPVELMGRNLGTVRSVWVGPKLAPLPLQKTPTKVTFKVPEVDPNTYTVTIVASGTDRLRCPRQIRVERRGD